MAEQPVYSAAHVSGALHCSESTPEVCDGVGLLPASAPDLVQLGVAAVTEAGAEFGGGSGAVFVGHIGVPPCEHQEGDLVG